MSLLYGQKAPILGVPTHSTLEDLSRPRALLCEVSLPTTGSGSHERHAASRSQAISFLTKS